MTDSDDIDFSESYEDREDKSIEELREETIKALEIAFSNIEYILGNANFSQSKGLFGKMESMRAATQEMISVLRSEEAEAWERREK